MVNDIQGETFCVQPFFTPVMATEDADAAPELEGDDAAPAPELEGEVAEAPAVQPTGAVVGEYTWDDFLREHDHEDAAAALYERFDEAPGSERWGETETTIGQKDWERTNIDPAAYLGFPPWELEARIGATHRVAEQLTESSPLIGYEQTPVIKDIYGWADYKREYFLDEEGNPPTDSEGEPETFDPSEALGFDPEDLGTVMADHERAGEELLALVDERTVDVNENVDEEEFFTDDDGRVTIANRYDLEKKVPAAKKSHFREEDRYWVNEPYSFIVIFHSTKENEKKYYVIEPHLNEIETDLKQYLSDKLRAAIKYEREGTTAGDETHRRSVIETETRELLDRYDLYDGPENGRSLGNTLAKRFDLDPSAGLSGRLVDLLGYEEPITGIRQLEGIQARPEPVLLEENADILNEYQVEKLLYYLERDFIGYERIDGIKHDINVEDISCNGYNSPVFVYHSDYEQIISNIYHGETELDDFVVKLAQRSGKGISKRRPQVDATLPDGSRAQLTLGREVSDHGTNYTIRQFKDVPFTPVDLINWKTFSLDQMAFLWLCIENDKSLIFAGGTASGKTTSLNAVSLFIPSNTKIVSIEDTREVELPQRNWIASVTRPSFTDDDKGDVDEFDLLEAALRQRPDYIVMGEVRGEEGRDLFQVMSTGHTSYSTFHADNVGEVLKRFTTEPINVSKTMFTALDLVSIQSSTRVQGHKVRRNKSLTEINHYDAENDEINVKDVYQWQAETDEFLRIGDSNTLDEIMFDRGWNREELDLEIFKRQVVLAYLIDRGLNTYTQVAATFQAFINDPETILALMANEQLGASLEDLREMESVLIDIDPDKEAMVPRPDPSDEIAAECTAILERADEELFEQFRGEIQASVAEALIDTEAANDIEVTPDTAGELPEGEESSVASGAESDEPGEDRAALDDVDPGELEDDSVEAMPALSAGEEAEEPQPSEAADALDTDEFDEQIGFQSEDETNGTDDGDESGADSTLDEAHEPDFEPFDPLSEEAENGTGGPDISAGDSEDTDDTAPPDEPVVLGEPEPSEEAEPTEDALSNDESTEFETESEPSEEFGEPTDGSDAELDDDTDPFTDDGTVDDEPSLDEEPTLGEEPEHDVDSTRDEGSESDEEPTLDEASDPGEASSLDDEPHVDEEGSLDEEPALDQEPALGESPTESREDEDAADEDSETVWGGDGDWDDLATELEQEAKDDEMAEVDSWDAGEEEDEE